MTGRAVGLVLGGLGLVAAGTGLRWPELTGLGAAAIALVLAALLTHARRPRASFLASRPVLRAVRHQPLQLNLPVAVARGTAALRVAVGDPRRPTASYALPRGREGVAALSIPVDTSRRGEHRLGPYTLLQSDPWGLVRRQVDEVHGGTLLVTPRVRSLSRGPLAEAAAADSETLSRRAGADHFHALRDYVLGDEPRKIHWRSSARAGRLVVRQEVAAASSGTAVVLDVDVTAYGSDEAFATAEDPERFETAVEVAASVAAAQARVTQRVHVLTTARDGAVTTTDTGAPTPLVDALAVVRPLPPVATSADIVASTVRKLRPSRVVLVTGSPSTAVQRLGSALSRSGARVLVVRTGARQRPSLAGVRALDVEGLDDLS